MNVELSQVEMNVIHLALKQNPLMQPTVTEDGLSTGQRYMHRLLQAILEKLPYRTTTEEEREASYKEVGVTPNDDYLREINRGNGLQW